VSRFVATCALLAALGCALVPPALAQPAPDGQGGGFPGDFGPGSLPLRVTFSEDAAQVGDVVGIALDPANAIVTPRWAGQVVDINYTARVGPDRGGAVQGVVADAVGLDGAGHTEGTWTVPPEANDAFVMISVVHKGCPAGIGRLAVGQPHVRQRHVRERDLRQWHGPGRRSLGRGRGRERDARGLRQRHGPRRRRSTRRRLRERHPRRQPHRAMRRGLPGRTGLGPTPRRERARAGGEPRDGRERDRAGRVPRAATRARAMSAEHAGIQAVSRGPRGPRAEIQCARGHSAMNPDGCGLAHFHGLSTNLVPGPGRS